MLKLAIAALVGTSALMAVPAPAQAQDYNRHRGGDTITCASHNGQYNSCRLPYRGNVRLVHQYSDRGLACPAHESCGPGAFTKRRDSHHVHSRQRLRRTRVFDF